MNNAPEIMCSTCIHFDVCKYKGTYCSVFVDFANNFDFIQDVRTRCPLYHGISVNDQTDEGWNITFCEHVGVDK